MKNRKFWLAGFSLGTGFVLALMGKLTAEYANICSIVNGAFAAADTLITRKHLENNK